MSTCQSDTLQLGCTMFLIYSNVRGYSKRIAWKCTRGVDWKGVKEKKNSACTFRHKSRHHFIMSELQLPNDCPAPFCLRFNNGQSFPRIAMLANGGVHWLLLPGDGLTHPQVS